MKAVAEGKPSRQWTTMVRRSSLDDFRRLRQSSLDTSDSVQAPNSGPPWSPTHKFIRTDSTQTQFLCDDSMDEELVENGSINPKIKSRTIRVKDEYTRNTEAQIALNSNPQFWTHSIAPTGTDVAALYNTPVKNYTLHPVKKEGISRTICDPLFPLSLPAITPRDASCPSLLTVGNGPVQGSSSIDSLWPAFNDAFHIHSTLGQQPSRGGSKLDEVLGVPVKRGFDNITTGTSSNFVNIIESVKSVDTKQNVPIQFPWSVGFPTQFNETQIYSKRNPLNMQLTSHLHDFHQLNETELVRTSHERKQHARDELMKRLNGGGGDHLSRMVALGDRNEDNEKSTQNSRRKQTGVPPKRSMNKSEGVPVVQKPRKRPKNASNTKRERFRVCDALSSRKQTTTKRRTLLPSSSSQDSEAANNGQTAPGGSTSRHLKTESRGRSTFADMVRDNVIKTGPQVWTVGHDANIHVFVKPNGCIVYKDSEFNSISSFALAVIRERNPSRLACDGWKDVKYEGKRLDSLRESYLSSTPF
eukprot:g8754.t1